MGKITFLHVSDFHFQEGTNVDSNLLFNEFLKDIKMWRKSKNNRKYDFIFITGDITHSGCSNDYSIAYKKLEEVISTAECESKGLFLVPGNHDIIQNRIRPVEEGLNNLIHRSELTWDNIFNENKDYEIFLDKFENYQCFINWFNNSNTLWEKDSFWFSRRIESKGIALRIIGLTTPLIMSREGNRRGEIVMVFRQLQEALYGRQEDEFTIVLGHHPINWLGDNEYYSFQVLLGKYCQIYLHGHTHMSRNFNLSFSPEIEYRSLAAGCLYHGSNYPNSYHIFQIDSDKNEFRLWPRKWYPEAQRWSANPTWQNLNSDGSWSTSLSKIQKLYSDYERQDIEFDSPYILGNKNLSFIDFPEVLTQTIHENERIDIAVVYGSGRFINSDHVSYGTDALVMPELITLLKDWNPKINFSSYLDIDIYNTKDLENKNLFIVGSGKVNYITDKLLKLFGNNLKFEFTPQYNVIVSNCGSYKRYADSGDPCRGILCLTKNPWATKVGNQRILVLMAGLHPIGTIAANYLLYNYIKNPNLRHNNYHDQSIPFKIVRGNPIGHSKYLERSSEVIDHPHNTPTYIGNIIYPPEIVE